MIKDHLQKELDKKKIFFVRYAILIDLAVTAILLFLLDRLKIDGRSILELFIKYYIK